MVECLFIRINWITSVGDWLVIESVYILLSMLRIRQDMYTHMHFKSKKSAMSGMLLVVGIIVVSVGGIR